MEHDFSKITLVVGRPRNGAKVLHLSPAISALHHRDRWPEGHLRLGDPTTEDIGRKEQRRQQLGARLAVVG